MRSEVNRGPPNVPGSAFRCHGIVKSQEGSAFFLENKRNPHTIAPNHPLKNGVMEARRNLFEIISQLFSILSVYQSAMEHVEVNFSRSN
jgi:hypothetical protein